MIVVGEQERKPHSRCLTACGDCGSFASNGANATRCDAQSAAKTRRAAWYGACILGGQMTTCPTCRADNWFYSTAAEQFRNAGTERWEPVWCGECEGKFYAVHEAFTGKFLRFEPRGTPRATRT